MAKSEQSKHAREIFEGALDISPAHERAAYVQQACGGDDALLRRVKALLQANERADSFLTDEPQERTAAAVLTEKPGDRIGRYKLLEKIGEGGMGVVYMAEQEEGVRRRVALKIIKLGMDTRQVVARFEAERQALALMDHPNIAKVLDAGATDTGRPYFVMELVQGVPITEFCDQNQFSAEQRVKLFIPVCQAIQSAHQKGIIHRDIKPTNVLVTLNAGVPHPMVIDFGVAKATNQKLTEKTLFTNFATMIGTPAYMSPEQAEMSKLDVDTRSDIYSLGVLLYELLTGTTPFPEKRLRSVAYREMQRIIVEEEPERPSTVVERLRKLTVERGEAPAPPRSSTLNSQRKSLSTDLDWIVLKCLEKDRNRRYETANGVAMDIQRHLSNEPVVARPPSTAYRFQKLVRRNKLAFAAGGALAAALVIGLTVSMWLFFKEKESHRRADAAARKSEQVAQFLKAMLEGVGPSKALGRDTAMLKEILDKTAARVGQDLTAQPDVEAELLQTLGEVAFLLAEHEKAEQWLSQALALRKKFFGEEHAEVANSLDSLALALYGQGKLEQAEQIGRDALAMQRKTRGNSHTNVATSLNNLGITLTVAGNFEAATVAYGEALNIRTNQLGNEHPEVAVTLNCLAQALHGKGNLRDAESAQRRALAIQRKVLPDPHPDLALSLNNLANLLQVQGKLDQAAQHYAENLKMQDLLKGDPTELATTLNNYGLLLERMGLWADSEAAHSKAFSIRTNAYHGDHPHVAFSLNNLASLRAATGRLAEAEALHQDALAMRRKLHGEENPDVAASIGNLARALRQQGRWAEAETMQNDALARRRKLPPVGEHPLVAVSLNELGLVLKAQDRPTEAVQLLRDAFDRRTKLLRSDDSNLAESAENLAMLLCDLGQFDEAGKLARQSLTIRELNYPDDWRRYNALAIVGTALLGQKQFAEAEPLLLAGYRGMEQRQDRIHMDGKPRLREALKRVVQLYEETARPSEAAEWKQKLETFDNPKK